MALSEREQEILRNLKDLPVFAAHIREGVETIRAYDAPLTREQEHELCDMVLTAAQLLDNVAATLLGPRRP